MSSILITGGAGFFGRHFVRFLLSTGQWERVCIYSRDEAKHARMRDWLNDDPRLRFFVGDVREQARLERAIHGVEYVVHAAALKRIEVGSYDPEEMVKTNIVGTMNVIAACRNAALPSPAHQQERAGWPLRFKRTAVLLSTDKAVQPISPYGLTKSVAEWLFHAANDSQDGFGPSFRIVRYGNVAGSTGSVIPTWQSAIVRGKRPRVADLAVTRFWLDVDEAIDLVLYAMHQSTGDRFVFPDRSKLAAFTLGDLSIAMDIVDWQRVPLGAYEKVHELMAPGWSSEHAPRMTIEQLRKGVERALRYSSFD